jgi:hypothetical protein
MSLGMSARLPHDVRFTESLSPSPGIWLIGAGLGAAFGLVLGPVDATAAVVLGAVGAVALITLLFVTTPKLIVTDATFRAGRAQLPLEVAGGVEVLSAEGMRKARGVEADARAFLLIRGWLPVGVKVTLHDPADPTPYWLISSRHPDRLATALRAGITRSGETGPA